MRKLLLVGLAVIASMGLFFVIVRSGNGPNAQTSIDEQYMNDMETAAKTIEASDIVSPRVIQRFINQQINIEQFGTQQQRIEAQQIMKDSARFLIRHFVTALDSLYNDQEFRNAVTNIILLAIQNALVPIALTSLQLSAGQASLADIGTAAEDGALYGATVALVAELGNKVLHFSGDVSQKVKNAMMLQGLEVLKQKEGFMSISTAGVSSIVLDQISKIGMKALETRGGAAGLLKQLDWKDVVIGQSRGSMPDKYRQPVDYFVDVFRGLLKDKKTRDIIGTILLSTVEGAAMGALLWYFGIWFVGEKAVALALQNTALRGAAQGLLNYVVSKTDRPGALQNVSSGLLVRDMQLRLLYNFSTLSVTDVAPVVLEEVTKSAVQTVVNQSGGWWRFISTAVGDVKEAAVSTWGWFGRKVSNIFNKIEEDAQIMLDERVLY